jgi:hypothetical protein
MDLPLIAVPRLLVQYYRAIEATPKSTAENGQPPYTPDLQHEAIIDEQERHLKEIHKLLAMSLLDFPAELVANSLVCLWNDLASNDSRRDFLRFQRGWVPHAILLGCLSGHAVELVVRFIEIACFLDLLCHQHDLAVAIVQALKSSSISRLGIWGTVPGPLARNMDDISQSSLAPSINTAAPFHAPRDVSLEYWLLTRPYVSEQVALAESIYVQPPKRNIGDVETRIDQLEALVSAINNEEGESGSFANNEFASSCHSELSDGESIASTTSEVSEISSSESETECYPEPTTDSVYHLALQTREKISRQLEIVRDSIHRKVTQSVSEVEELAILAQKPAPRAFYPFDQRTIFRARPNVENTPRERQSTRLTTLHSKLFDTQEDSLHTRVASNIVG